MQKALYRRPLPPNFTLQQTDINPIIQRILASRQINPDTQLNHTLKYLLPYHQLNGIQPAVALLKEALSQQQRILIVADYDADGATSCSVAVKALRLMGAKHVAYLVPNREKHGYGLTPEIIDLAMPFCADLLVTVDNGISSIAGVARAKACNIKVLITDHHLPPPQLPAADAIVNPNQSDDVFPSKNLAGVGVIFYVMLALRAALREADWFTQQALPEPNLAELLDLVALGTVADVVKLDYNNRILVAQGLARMRANSCSAGIRALIKVAQREQSELVAGDLGFALGPRLNAAGRMDDMSYGIACLLSENDAEAWEHAQNLDMLNQERRVVEAEMHQEALAQLADVQLQLNENLPVGLCLFDEKWHQGVIGILASRIKDRLHRPVIVFTVSNNNEIKGSARSVAGVHIRDVLENIAMQHPQLLSRFGGHAMAAGLSLAREDYATFCQLFDEAVRHYLPPEDIQGKIYTDGELSPSDFTLPFAEQLRHLLPWGQDVPEPIFEGIFEILDKRILKNSHLKMVVRPLPAGLPVDAIAFNMADVPLSANAPTVKMAFRLEVNFYKGLKSLQLMVDYLEELSH
ncbi:single-stranded-DNA-specific exonuclease RecJ [Beggiatoa leptomitoformis]|uniref:Single-stranded-DNA-specific exonuclease RecJ n=1 Tax=Beggiatoa leptomitoformis TaxID=288004 RepID=A0A2N9YGI3_9GAMM|nr:single-stranded-DNA-specific exonuclease RecJ [Beggiatoa leptomitoformis]ALG68200.1 single-stranded-DNA-specific exonuclease RecJ [Beggiatoa leptomitoformis]AUI69495.1 single-stranded-DNA-specific exonuclease RecJ [Beggiatoa leptomitoformis]